MCRFDISAHMPTPPATESLTIGFRVEEDAFELLLRRMQGTPRVTVAPSRNTVLQVISNIEQVARERGSGEEESYSQMPS